VPQERRTKIVATLGPSSDSRESLRALVAAGVDAARLNLSHGTHEEHAERARLVREVEAEVGRPVALIADLQGPKLRIGELREAVVLRSGDRITVCPEDAASDGELPIAPAVIGDVLKTGHDVLIDDGLVRLRVGEVSRGRAQCEVVVGGRITSHKGVNLPGVPLPIPSITRKDSADLQFALELGVDFVALSFVRSPDDIDEAVKLATLPNGKHVPIVAKIEKPEAIERLEEIVDRADGIMVARGDLGVEMGAEKVPLIQKRAIELTNAKGKVVITATQMLESMITNPRPTRAEASDVANAVLDGSDALMLSGETASGKYPLLAVRTMARIIEEIEDSSRFKTRFDAATLDFATSANAIAKAAVVAARQMNASVIACVTESGGVARLVSEYRPEARLVAFTSREPVYRRLALYWGVEAVKAQQVPSFDEMLVDIEKQLVYGRFAKAGDLVVLVVAVPIGAGHSANTLHIHKIGN
jgi:pyruvate kinase